jgi:hypothetical protein
MVEKPKPITAKKHADGAKDFYLKEYECLRKEIDMVLKDHRALERNIVVVVGVIWAWLLDEHHAHNMYIPPWAWFIPCLFVVLGIMRATGNATFFTVTNEYIHRVEDVFSSDGDPGGWDHFSLGRTWIRKSTIAFWSLLLISTIVVAFYEVKIKPQ